jgi:hypothetical protein
MSFIVTEKCLFKYEMQDIITNTNKHQYKFYIKK